MTILVARGEMQIHFCHVLISKVNRGVYMKQSANRMAIKHPGPREERGFHCWKSRPIY
jgi:hypothetical protein